jgi:hypothetical protein
VPETLTKNDEFFKGAPTGAAVTGSGQMVYWQRCTIKVYKSGEENAPVSEITKCDGQALVRKGTSLLLEDGPVKEE